MMKDFDKMHRVADEIVDAIGGDNLLLMYVLDAYSKKHNITKITSKLGKNGDIRVEISTKPNKKD